MQQKSALWTARCLRSKNSLTKLDDYLPKVIGMSCPVGESSVTGGRLVALPALGDRLLYITETIHGQSDGVYDDIRNISPCAECWLWMLRNIWRVQHSDQ